MLRPRVIPCLLLRGQALVKTVGFAAPSYVGDPVNAVRIFNEKEVDELVLLDIAATPAGKGPDLELVRDVASECFMPLAYGGGVRTLEQLQGLFAAGVEKVVVNTITHDDPTFLRAAADRHGAQSLVASIDVRRGADGVPRVVTHGNTRITAHDPVAWAEQLCRDGAGELLVTSVDRDGTQRGYDLPLLESITRAVDVPVVAAGGAGSLLDVRSAIRDAGASAAALGSMSVYFGRHRAVLINFPRRADIAAALA
jgi:imidazole glycerol-phosphate synthase subunit HisF